MSRLRQPYFPPGASNSSLFLLFSLIHLQVVHPEAGDRPLARRTSAVSKGGLAIPKWCREETTQAVLVAGDLLIALSPLGHDSLPPRHVAKSPVTPRLHGSANPRLIWDVSTPLCSANRRHRAHLLYFGAIASPCLCPVFCVSLPTVTTR